jgi:signal transduction histidine kinase
MDAINRALAEQKVIPVEYEVEMPPHGARVYEARVAPAGAGEVIAIVRDITESRRFQQELSARVAERTRDIENLTRRLVSVQEEERRRIGRELHDEIGQMLTALSIMIAAARRAPETSAARLEDAVAIVHRLMNDVRELSFDLVAAAQHGLAEAVRSHARTLSQRSGLDIDVTCGELERLPGEVETAAFRIVQEALTNVVRHAGANRALVSVSLSESTLRLAVEDDGVGFDDGAAGHRGGLAGMSERARILGGTLRIDSAPGRGTEVRVRLP